MVPSLVPLFSTDTITTCSKNSMLCGSSKTPNRATLEFVYKLINHNVVLLIINYNVGQIPLCCLHDFLSERERHLFISIYF